MTCSFITDYINYTLAKGEVPNLPKRQAYKKKHENNKCLENNSL